MAFIKAHTILSDLVQEQIEILPMLHRFGIRLGLGDATISEICEDRNIDTVFFLHILNSYLNPDYLGRLKVSTAHLSLFADYLEETNRSYLSSQLPNIEVHISSFVRRSDSNNPLFMTLPHVLTQLRETLEERIRVDEEEFLPRFRAMAQRLAGNISSITLEQPLEEWTTLPIDRTEALVGDMMQVLIRHLKGDFNDNLLHAVLYSLSMLRNDLASNNRLRARLLDPMMEAMDKALKEK